MPPKFVEIMQMSDTCTHRVAFPLLPAEKPYPRIDSAGVLFWLAQDTVHTRGDESWRCKKWWRSLRCNALYSMWLKLKRKNWYFKSTLKLDIHFIPIVACNFITKRCNAFGSRVISSTVRHTHRGYVGEGQRTNLAVSNHDGCCTLFHQERA